MRRARIAVTAVALSLGLAAPALAGTVSVGAGATFDLGTGSASLGCADLDVLGTFSAGSVGFTGGRDVTITSSGVLNGDSATLELSGDWDNAGDFAAGTSHVRMVDGCGLLSAVVSGKSKFNDLSVTSASAKQIAFTAGTTQRVNGVLTLTGASGSRLRIRSTEDGVAAFLDVQGSSSANHVDVQDNDASPGSPIVLGSDSVKGSNTPGWQLASQIPLPPVAGAILALALLVLARRALWSNGRGSDLATR